MGIYNPWGYAYGYAGCNYGFGNNGFILLVVLFVLLIIAGNNFPTGEFE